MLGSKDLDSDDRKDDPRNEVPIPNGEMGTDDAYDCPPTID